MEHQGLLSERSLTQQNQDVWDDCQLCLCCTYSPTDRSLKIVLRQLKLWVANQVTTIHHNISRCLYRYLQQQLIS